MCNRETQVSFDALLAFAVEENARLEMAALPTPAALQAAYPDTAKWDANIRTMLQQRNRKGRPTRVVRRILVTTVVAAALFGCAMMTSAEVRYAVKNTILQWTKSELRLTYATEGTPHAPALPAGYCDHVILDGFIRDEQNLIQSPEQFSHGYDKMVDGIKKSYSVECYSIQPEGQLTTFDREHTTYTTVTFGDVAATLGTSLNFDGSTSYVLFWNQGEICNIITGNLSLNEMLEVAKGIHG